MQFLTHGLQTNTASDLAAAAKQREAGRERNIRVLLADLKACSNTRNLERGKQVHAEAVEFGYDSNIYLASTLINMYAKCSSMASARQVFHSMKHPDVVSWTALILGYAEAGEGIKALELFARMIADGPAPDSVTFVAALKACTCLAVRGCSDRGRAVHNLAAKTGCASDAYVQGTLIDTYSKCASMLDARQVFDSMRHRDVVCWNALILGYAENGQGFTCLDLFARMRIRGPAPTSVTFIAALKACSALAVNGASACAECSEWGMAIHNLAVDNGCNSDMYLQSSLIDMYFKCRSMVPARRVFDGMKIPDAVSWNTLILGYADNGQGHVALDLFTRMKSEGPAPDPLTFAGALRACASLGALEMGRMIHSEIDRGNQINLFLVNCLVDFYAKCGSLLEAQSVFDVHAGTRDVITWNALLGGYSGRGDSESVFRLFKEMQEACFQPDGVTFLCILTCCSHAGLVEKGKECFDAMSLRYGIRPSLEHFNCMLDLLGRANKLEDAMALLDRMPWTPNDVSWSIILAACRKWKNVELGRLAFQCLTNCSERDEVVMGQTL